MSRFICRLPQEGTCQQARLRLRARVAVATVVICALAAIAACSQNKGSAGDSRQGDVLTIGVTAAPSSLDPAKDTYGPASSVIEFLAHEPLTTLNKDGSVGPGLARSFHYVGNGNQVFELTIRDGARFSDGEPVTAQAVKNWLEYFSKTPGVHQKLIAIKSVDAIDQSTVRINLISPNPLMPLLLARGGSNWGFVSSPRSVQDPDSLGKITTGAGPYTLDVSATVTGDHYTFIPNNFYHDKSAINFSRVVVKVISNPSSMLQAIQAGQIDVAQGDASTADAAEQSGLTVEHAPNFINGIFILDRSGVISKPLSDVRVRQALNYAVNRTAINTAIYGKYGTPTSEWTTLDGWDPAYQNYYKHDPLKAKSLLAQAGYPTGFELPVLCNGTFPAIAKMCQAVAEDLKAVGVIVEIISPTTTAEANQKFLSGTFPAYMGPLGIDPTWTAVPQALMPGGIQNQHGWNDPLIDQDWQHSTSAPTEEATADWKRIVARTVTQAYFVPLNVSDQFYYVSKRVGGVSLSSPVDWGRGIVTEWYANK